jgi:Domain of unknown function (DUF4352)
MSVRHPHRSGTIFLLSIITLMVAACSAPIQVDPPGQNSGSTQNAPGAFLYDDPAAVTGAVGQTLSIYDIFTTITTNFTVNTVSNSNDAANLNSDTAKIPDHTHFLLINITLQNASNGDAASCPQGKCVSYYSPLSNFRLVDDKGRQWYTTTAASENCTSHPHDLCYNRLWVDEANKGVLPGQSFNSRLAYNVPDDMHTFTLYFAPYRFSDSQGNAANAATPTSSAGTPTVTATAAATTATPSTSHRATLAKVSINS